MIQAISSFVEGIRYQRKGIRFAFQHHSLLLLALLPFLIAGAVYTIGFYLFAIYADDLLNAIWHVEPGTASWLTALFYWIYINILRYFLYLVILVVMLYTFIIFANIVGSPLYERIAAKIESQYAVKRIEAAPAGRVLSQLLVLKEEVKKNFLMLFLPVMLFFVPVIGTVSALIIAPIFIAWEYVDYTLSRDHVLLRERLGVVWRHKFHLLGFGLPLLIPIFGLLFIPFAIFGATQLYFEKIRKSDTNQSGSAELP